MRLGKEVAPGRPTRWLAILLVAVLLALIPGCGWAPFSRAGSAAPPPDAAGPGGEGDAQAAPARVQVVTTLFSLAEFTRAVGGDRVEVGVLLEPGLHAHDFEPTPKDTERILAADLFIYNGASFEPWVAGVLAAVASSESKVHVVDASRRVQLLPFTAGAPSGPVGEGGDEHDHDPRPAGGQLDYHVWLDPVRAVTQVETIRDALVQVDPAGAPLYAQRAAAYIDELQALHQEFTAGLASCRVRDLVVQHAAFGYLAERYGLNQIAVSGLAADQEPSPRQLAELAALVRQRGVRAVYYEQLVDARVAEVLAAEAGAEALVLHPLENLTRDEMERGETYLSIMRWNLEQLRRGLDCPGN